MSTFLKDLRYAARMLLKNPGFSAVAVVALALGIGANTAIFSVVNAVLLRPLPYPQPEEVVAVWAGDNSKPDPRTAFSFPDFADLRAQNQVFSAMAAYDDLDMTVTERGADAEHLHGSLVASDLFRVLDVNPMLGRAFTAEDDKPGARVAILSYELWQRRFGGDRGVLAYCGYDIHDLARPHFGLRPRPNLKPRPVRLRPPRANAVFIICTRSRG